MSLLSMFTIIQREHSLYFMFEFLQVALCIEDTGLCVDKQHNVRRILACSLTNINI